MALNTINVTMQQKRGTRSEWKRIEPVLKAGEIGFITDENKIVIGDGTNSFSFLVPLGITESEVKSWITGSTVNITMSDNDFLTASDVDVIFENANMQIYAGNDNSFMNASEVDAAFQAAGGGVYTPAGV